jgi:hypothetical protein
LILLLRPGSAANSAVWSVIGGSAAVLLAVPQDYGLILAGAIAGMFLLGQRMRPCASSRTPA